MDYINISKIEEESTKVREQLLYNRERFESVDPEYLISRYGPDLVRMSILPLGERILGRLRFEQGIGIIEIDSSHYEKDNIAKVNYTIAHELGHYILHKGDFKNYMSGNFDKLGELNLSTENPKIIAQREREANRFAAALLIPRDEISELHTQFFKVPLGLQSNRFNLDLYRALGTEKTLELIEKWSKIWKVSSFCLSIRMKELGLLNVYGHSFIRYGNDLDYIAGF